MRTLGRIGLLVALPLVLFVGCDSRGIGGENDNDLNQNQNDNQNHTNPLEILLTVYGSTGEVVETRTVEGMGPVTIAPAADEPNPPAYDYVVMAQAEAYYTRLFQVGFGGSVDIQLDGVPELSRALTGVVIRTSYFEPPCYHARSPLRLTDPDGIVTTVTTDDEGRYRLTDGKVGTYSAEVQCEVWEYPMQDTYELTNGADTNYWDLFYEIDMRADAPNLYLYPEQRSRVQVSLGFPLGGEVVLSDPPYGQGWDVSASPDGTINGTHPFLFYEARLPYRVQRERGWLLAADALEEGFQHLLAAYGFQGRELTDFTDYWLPLMTGAPYYAIYPMAADELVKLSITPAPDRLRRLWLLMEPHDAPMSIQPPRLPAPLHRAGFTAVEWGAFLSR